MQANFFEQGVNKPGLVAGAAGLMVVAGLTHLVIVPIHWAHAPAHGLFFVLMGLAQIAWGIAFWRKPSIALYRVGVILAGGLITLWIITRLLPAPFEHEPGPIDIFGIICKAAEFLGIAMLVTIVVAGATSREMRLSAWRMVGVLVLVAIVSGWAAYGFGYTIEPALPWLGGGGGHHQEQPGQEHGASEEHKGSGQEHGATDHNAESEHDQESTTDHNQEHGSEHEHSN